MTNSYLNKISILLRKTDHYRKSPIILFFLFFVLLSNIGFSQTDSILYRKIIIPEQKTTIYELLTQITDQTGYFFMYDSKLVNSDKVIKVSSQEKTLKQILTDIIENPSLDFKVVERHILIYSSNKRNQARINQRSDSLGFVTLNGRILDRLSNESISFASIGILEKNIGTISNFDGYFSLKIPNTLLNSSIVVSHLGYKNQQIPAKLLINNRIDIFLETNYISIQEVIIHNFDPLGIVKKAYQSRSVNYPQKPIYQTSFYREGVIKNDKYLNYSEAVLNIYKSSYSRSEDADQIKIYKSRSIVNIDQNDTLILKLKSGLKSCLTLDIVKSVPDFLDPEYIDNYNFTKADIVSINSRNAYAIAFEQKGNIPEPLFKGTLYIDMNNFAIVSAEFEVNPELIKDASDQFIVKRSRKFSTRPERINYVVTYNQWNGKYYINHIRGDLTFKFKKRYSLFSNKFHTFLELASCQIDTVNITRFNHEEVIKPNLIFVDTKFLYDEEFWGNYNTIIPEEKLSEALSRINSKIEVVNPN